MEQLETTGGVRQMLDKTIFVPAYPSVEFFRNNCLFEDFAT